jgi:hypothetical protein
MQTQHRGGLAWLDAESRRASAPRFVECSDAAARRDPRRHRVSRARRPELATASPGSPRSATSPRPASSPRGRRQGPRLHRQPAGPEWRAAPDACCVISGELRHHGVTAIARGGSMSRQHLLISLNASRRRLHRQPASTPASTCAPGSSVRDGDVLGVWSPTRRTPPRRQARARLGRRRRARVQEHHRDGRRPGHRRDLADAARTTRASRTSRRSAPRSRAARAPCAASPARSRWRATWPRRSGAGRAGARRGLSTGYLENQLFSPGIERGRELIWARGAADHRPAVPRARGRGAQRPARPWFWQGEKLQGGGVLNDMMCHSASRSCATCSPSPAKPRSSLTPGGGQRPHRVAQVEPSALRRAAQGALRQGRRLREAPREDFASGDDRPRDRRPASG